MIKKYFLKTIRFYQNFVSPIFGQNCRFYPSCSGYTSLAIKKYGIIKGSLLGLKRILKCHPYNRGGIDLP